MNDTRKVNPFANIGKHLKEIEINELKSFIDSISREEIYLSMPELKRILNEELNIQILTNEEVNEIIAPIKRYILKS